MEDNNSKGSMSRRRGFRTRTTIFSPGRCADGEVYANAQRQLARSRRDIQKVFDDLDLLVFLTMADPPVKIEVGGLAAGGNRYTFAIRTKGKKA